MTRDLKPVQIGTDKTPPIPAVTILGTVLTDQQVSVLRELIWDGCRTSGEYRDSPIGLEFSNVCGELYQLIKTLR